MGVEIRHFPHFCSNIGVETVQIFLKPEKVGSKWWSICSNILIVSTPPGSTRNSTNHPGPGRPGRVGSQSSQQNYNIQGGQNYNRQGGQNYNSQGGQNYNSQVVRTIIAKVVKPRHGINIFVNPPNRTMIAKVIKPRIGLNFFVNPPNRIIVVITVVQEEA